MRRRLVVKQPEIDTRVWRQVIRYNDQRQRDIEGTTVRFDAIDVLECGHEYTHCTRQPGGHKAVGHQEPCLVCEEAATC